MDYVSYIRSLVGNHKIIMNAAACIVLNEDNQVLLQHRGDDHFWGLPGGIMELGETIEQTARREVFEETGLTIKDPIFLGTFYNPHKVWPNGDEAHILCHVFIVRKTTGILHIDGEETLDLNYVTYPHLPPIDAIDHKEAIAYFFQESNEL